MTITVEPPLKESPAVQAVKERGAGGATPDRPQTVLVSLLGGPLYDLGVKLKLVRGESNTTRIGIVIGWASWLLLMLFATIAGEGSRLFIPGAINVHTRLLLVIPMFFLCESLFDPIARKFVRSLVVTEIVPDSEKPELFRIIRRLNRWIDSRIPDTVCLLTALSMGSAGRQLLRLSAASASDPVAALLHKSLLIQASLVGSLMVFRFLLLRWTWRLVLWFLFLWRLSRMRLHLMAAHSDRTGGLGGLEIVHLYLLPLIGAFSVVVSSSLAQDLAAGAPFAGIYPAVVVTALASLALVFGPLLFFMRPLTDCRNASFFGYMALVTRYVHAFENRWLSSGSTYDELLGTSDLQSLADLTNSVNVVREMRFLPAGRQLFLGTAFASLLPLLPLWLFQYPPSVLLSKLVEAVIG